MQYPTHCQIDKMEHYVWCVKHAESIAASDAFAFAFGKFLNWFALGIPSSREPGVLRYRITISPDISMPYSFYGALLRDMEGKIRGSTEMVRNGGLVYNEHAHTWGVHT